MDNGEKVIGTFKDNNYFGFIETEDGKQLVEKGNFGNASDGDKVEAINISENPNVVSYKVIRVINETKKLVENTIIGTYKQIDKYSGIVFVPGKQKVIINKGDNFGAITGDKVNVILNDSSKRVEGIVKEIIAERTQKFLGIVDKENGKYYVNFTEPNFNKKIPLIVEKDLKLNKGEVVSYKINREDPKNIFGIFDKVQGKDSDKGIDILIKAAEKGASFEFPEYVLKEADNLSVEITPEEINKRKDLRNLFTITIDGPDSKDLDDAISIEVLSDGRYKLYVHIADVSHFVKEGSALDTEALDRGTSIYLVDKVIPMLPEKLSNNLCSLNPNTDKLSKTCEIIIEKDGTINFDETKVYKSIINSNFRTTYKEVSNLSEGNYEGDTLMFGGYVNEDLKNLCFNSKSLAEIINLKLNRDGELKFELPETKVEVDNDGKVIGFKEYNKYDSNEWIKAFMVAANQAVSNKYEKNPFLYRTHRLPSLKKILELKEILNYFDFEFDFDSEESSINDLSKKISKLLNEIKGHEAEKFLTKTILTSLPKAIYTSDDNGHFGLGLDYYSHFTSPIRRYPDLQIHRIIDEIIDGKDVNYFNEILDDVAEHSSYQEVLQEDIERYINKIKAIELLEQDLDKEYTGEITLLSGYGNQVTLDNTIEGDLFIDKSFQKEELCKGLNQFKSRSGEIFNIGKKIKVKVKEIDKEKLEIYFQLV